MLLPALATISLAHDTAVFSYQPDGLTPLLSQAIRRRVRRQPSQPDPVVLSAKDAAKCGLADFVGTAEATDAELQRLWVIFQQIPASLMSICKAELPSSSLEAAMLVMGALDTRGRERKGDEGSFVRLCVDDHRSVATLELNDPDHFNSFSW